jgi:enoyl-CoA hydratase/carnithine racemase
VSETPVLVDRVGRVAILRLNRPRVLNALSPELVDALIREVGGAATDPAVGCILIAAEGRAFCAGGDLTAMLAMDAPAFRAYIGRLQALSLAMRHMPIPSVAALHGHVLAGGFELAIECDVRIASRDVTFGLPDTQIGFSPTSGMSWLLPRLVGESWARHMLLTGETIDIATAERIGLVTRVVDRTDLDQTALAVAAAIAALPPVGLRNIRAEIAAAQEGTFEDALARELEAEVECFATPELEASLRAFAARRGRSEPRAGG